MPFYTAGEVGELAECFQWRAEGDAGPGLPGFSGQERTAVVEELADVLLYLVRLSQQSLRFTSSCAGVLHPERRTFVLCARAQRHAARDCSPARR